MKRKRKSSAKNKLQGSAENALIKVEPERSSSVPGVYLRSQATAIARSSLFTAEFEEVIEIIARERVYRDMLTRLGRRLLMAPSAMDHDEVI